MTPDDASQVSPLTSGAGAGTMGTSPGWRRLAPAAPALLLAAAVLVGFAGYSYDDAFITYRYALNLAEEGRLAFNPGTATYGTSAPGFAALLAGLGRLSPGETATAIPIWGSVLGVAGLLAVPLVLLAWGGDPRRAGDGGGQRGAWLAAAGPLLLALRWNVEMLGAEALPALGMVALAAWLLFARGREVPAGLALAAAAMLRLDAGLAALVFGLVWWARRRRFPWRLAVAGSLPLALYAGWLWLHFGQLLPDTLDAKQAEMIFTRGSLTAAQWAWLVRVCGTLGGIALLGFAVLGVVRLIAAGHHRLPGVMAAGCWLGLHEAAYRLVVVPFAPWYHLPTLAAVVLLAGWGASALVARVLASRPGPAAPARRRAPAWGVAAGATALLLPVWISTAGWWVGAWGQPPDPRWEVYHRVGEHVRATSAPGDAVAAVEIGFLAYSSHRPILDLMGLVSPEVVPAREAGELAGLVAERRPRYILDVPLFRRQVLDEILEHERIESCYAPAATFPAPQLMGAEVTLLERRPVPACR